MVLRVLIGLCICINVNSLVAEALKPLKVFVMAGQSNMQGRARITTLKHMLADPKTKAMAEKMADESLEPKVINKAWIAALGVKRSQEEKFGPLMAGYGYDAGGSIKIGPEMGFGITMQEKLNEPILIIKTTWGGKSLFCDFRPPSAGPWDFGKGEAEKAKDPDKTRKDIREKSGLYYHKMKDYVQKVLSDIKRVYPGYDPKQGYEMAGFMWFQGVHDYGNGATYPNLGSPGCYDEYSRLLACFIRDVRKDFSAPKMPFVIGVLGISGDLRHMDKKLVPWTLEFRKAMAEPAFLPEFKGNVKAVLTEKYWDHQLEELTVRNNKLKKKTNELRKEQVKKHNLKIDRRHFRRLRLDEEFQAKLDAYEKEVFTTEEIQLKKDGISNAAYHYLGSYKIYSQIGEAFADAIFEMSQQ